MKAPFFRVKTFDDDPCKDDFIGGGEVNLEHWMANPGEKVFFEMPLEAEGKVVGQMNMEYFYDPKVIIL